MQALKETTRGARRSPEFVRRLMSESRERAEGEMRSVLADVEKLDVRKPESRDRLDELKMRKRRIRLKLWGIEQAEKNLAEQSQCQ